MAGDDPKSSSGSGGSGDSDAAAPPPSRGAHLRTKPLDDANQFREALQAELRKHARPTLLVVAGPDVGMRIRLDRSLDIGRDPSASFPLRDESVSWRHVRVEDRGG